MEQEKTDTTIQKGLEYEKEGEYIEAENKFKIALVLDPENYSYNIHLARIYKKQRKYIDAEEIVDKLIENFPDKAEAYYYKYNILQFEGRFSEANKILSTAISVNTRNNKYGSPEYWRLRNLCDDNGIYPETEKILKKEVKNTPDNIQAYFNLAQFLNIRRKYAEVDEIFKKIIKIAPNNPSITFNLGQYYIERKKIKEAQEIFNHIIKDHPDYYRAYVSLGLIFSQKKNIKKAEQLYRKAIEIEPNDDYAYDALWHLYFNNRMLEKCDEIEQLKPHIGIWKKPKENPEDYLILAQNHMIKKNLIKAQQFINRALELKPSSAIAFMMLARLYQKQSEYTKAIDAYKKAIKMQPNNGEIHYLLSQIYAHKRNKLQFLSYLSNSINYGVHFKEYAENDNVFDDYREDTQFKKLISNDYQETMEEYISNYCITKNSIKKNSLIINKLSNLKELTISYNEIEEIPEYIFEKELLYILDLSHNKISSISKNISNLSSLQYLNLSYNSFLLYPVNINKCKNLHELNLSNNNLSLIPANIQYLKKLKF